MWNLYFKTETKTQRLFIYRHVKHWRICSIVMCCDSCGIFCKYILKFASTEWEKSRNFWPLSIFDILSGIWKYKGNAINSRIIILKQEIWKKTFLTQMKTSPHVISWAEMNGRELSDNKSPSFSFLSLLYAFLSLLSNFTTLIIFSRNDNMITDEWRVAKNSDGSGPGLIQAPVWHLRWEFDDNRHKLSLNVL